MSNQTDKYDVHAAINDVMARVGYVQKERVSGLNYSFAGEAALIQALRPAMVETGLYVHPTGVTMITSEAYVTKSGTSMNRFVGAFSFRFTHAPSGTWVDVVCLGEGADAGDKACNKAMTGAYKYALRQTFCIETGDDPDRQPSEEQERDHYTRIENVKPESPRQPISPPAATVTNEAEARWEDALAIRLAYQGLVADNQVKMPGQSTEAQIKKLQMYFPVNEWERNARLTIGSFLTGRRLNSFKELTKAEAAAMITAISHVPPERHETWGWALISQDAIEKGQAELPFTDTVSPDEWPADGGAERID